jgi:hypothetical protein
MPPLHADVSLEGSTVSETSQVNLRKADFWTSLVLLAIGAGMLLKALSMPLEGTYAGVTNAWYVSPALFPLIVAGFLLLLSLILLANAVRTGGASAALRAFRRQKTHASAGSEAFWIVGGVLGAYIYILVPRVDFIAATTLLLFTLVAVFDLRSTRAARRALLVYAATAAAVLGMALFLFELPPQSAEAYARDASVWMVVAVSMGVVAVALREEPENRTRFARCVWVSLLTPLILSTSFKYGLLVPLPNEGVTIEVLDRIRYGVPGLF